MYVLAGVIFVVGFGLLIGLASLCELIKALMEVMKEQTIVIGKLEKTIEEKDINNVTTNNYNATPNYQIKDGVPQVTCSAIKEQLLK
jgi:hypothetical protein